MAQHAKKGARRTAGVTVVMNSCKRLKDELPKDWSTTDEATITSVLHGHIVRGLAQYYANQGFVKSAERAKLALLWEKNPEVTVNNITFLGTQHRPDFVVVLDRDTQIAVEIKRGDSGQAVRDGLGQSLVYSSAYEFVAFLFVDTSRDGRIARSTQLAPEAAFIQQLWANHNIQFSVI